MGSDWAPAVFLSILALTVGGVILLRPLVLRLSEYLELLIRAKRDILGAKRDMELLGQQMQRIEERLDFAARLTAGSPIRSASSAERPQPLDPAER